MKTMVSLDARSQWGVSASLTPLNHTTTVKMSSRLASLTNVVQDVVRAALDFIVDSVIRAHSANTENMDKLTPASTPLSTATTAPKSSPENSIPISTVVTVNAATVKKSWRRLEIPSPESENKRVPMSEELGEKLFSQGYDSDGFILDFDIDTDMHSQIVLLFAKCVTFCI